MTLNELAQFATTAQSASDLARLWCVSTTTVYARLRVNRALQLRILKLHAAKQRRIAQVARSAMTLSLQETIALRDRADLLDSAWAPRHLRARHLEGQAFCSAGTCPMCVAEGVFR